MSWESLPDPLAATIQQKIEDGDALLDDDRYEQAEQLYRTAASMIPEPKSDYSVTLDAYIALGESLFYQLRFNEALEAFQQAITAPGGVRNPLAHFRLGQANYHLGNEPVAEDAFGRAVVLGGQDLFEGEDNEQYRAIVAPLLGLARNMENLPDSSTQSTPDHPDTN